MKYMFEIDILGENGRIRLHDNAMSYNVYQFYKNEISYESLKLISSKQNNTPNERMVDAILIYY